MRKETKHKIASVSGSNNAVEILKKKRQEVVIGNAGKGRKVAVVNGVVREGLTDQVNFEGT